MDNNDIGPIRIYPVDDAGYRTDREPPPWRKAREPVAWWIVTAHEHQGHFFYVNVPFIQNAEMLRNSPQGIRSIHAADFENALLSLAWIIEDPERIKDL